MATKAPPKLHHLDKEIQLDIIKQALGDVIAVGFDPKADKQKKI